MNHETTHYGATGKGFAEIQNYLNSRGFWFRGRCDGDVIFGRSFDEVELRFPIPGGMVTAATVLWLDRIFEEEQSDRSHSGTICERGIAC